MNAVRLFELTKSDSFAKSALLYHMLVNKEQRTKNIS